MSGTVLTDTFGPVLKTLFNNLVKIL